MRHLGWHRESLLGTKSQFLISDFQGGFTREHKEELMRSFVVMINLGTPGGTRSWMTLRPADFIKCHPSQIPRHV